MRACLRKRARVADAATYNNRASNVEKAYVYFSHEPNAYHRLMNTTGASCLIEDTAVLLKMQLEHKK